MESEEQRGGANAPEGEVAPTPVEPTAVTGGSGGEPPPPKRDEGDDEEEGMLRMSFLQHLEELRTRLILALAGLGVSFVLCLVFANQIWRFISAPALEALKNTGADPNLVFLQPTEAFAMIWIKAPLLASIFLAAPWILYQVWAFIAPGLYRKERRWAAPFVLCTAGLFILGGAFAYFVAFRFALEFLLSIGRDISVKPMITATYYFDLFVNVTLGIGLVFELPVLLFFLTLLRIVSPRFLMRNVRYAILAIAIIAAVVTPTPDIFNMMLFAVPMWGLFFVGVFASYLLVLHREKRRFPWKKILYGLFIVLVIMAGALYLIVTKYGYHLAARWPFLIR
jgi:sec-independent protein translocase protein TatC